jgi:tetratricopeptide (TPR) repeat protein
MLQIFSRAERKSNRVLNIGFVTQDGEISRQFREHVAQFGGIKVSLVASERVTAGFDGRGLSVFVYDLDTASEPTLQEFERFMNQRPQHLPVIVLSPAVDDQLVRWFLRLRVADWVKTPLSPGELVTTCARVLAQSGSNDLADQAYGRVLQLASRNAVILNNAGYSQLLRGDLKSARRFFLKAYELEPENPYIANNLRLLGESEKSVKRVEL